MTKAAAIFDRVYSRTDMYYGCQVREDFAQLAKSIPLNRFKALDLGCGEGRYSIFMAESGSAVHSVDFSAVGIAKLEKMACRRHLPITMECLDLRDFGFPADAFDLVVCATVLDHLSTATRRRVIQGIHNTLKAGGLFYGNVFTKEDPGSRHRDGGVFARVCSETAPAIAHYFCPNELLDCFRGMEVLSYKECIEEDLSHGPVHFHSWAVIIGKKP